MLQFNNNQRIELRDDGRTLVGYAAVFYDKRNAAATEYAPFAGHVERIVAGAFRGLIESGSEVFAAVNHNVSRILGRRSAGTLAIEEDRVGLRYTVDIPDTTFGRDTAEEVRRGDFAGSSIGFQAEPDGSTRTREGQVSVRTITEVAVLRDLGPVHVPAFSGTSVEARSAELLLPAWREFERRERLARITEIVVGSA